MDLSNAQPAARPAAAAASHRTAAAPSQPTAESDDQEQIRALLGSNFVAEPSYLSLDGNEDCNDGGKLMGRKVLIKYGTTKWYMATPQIHVFQGWRPEVPDGTRPSQRLNPGLTMSGRESEFRRYRRRFD